MENKKKLLEAVLFLENNPVSLYELEQMLDLGELELVSLIGQLEVDLKERDSALYLDKVDDRVFLRPGRQIMDELAEVYGEGEKRRFSRVALEVLSIVAWKQPVTRSEVDAIRGVDSSNALRNLIAGEYVQVVGKKEVPGRPQLYGTTENFLRYFGLGSLDELPRIDDLKEMYDH